MTEVGEPLVRVENVSKHFGEGETRVNPLRNVSLNVFSPGRVVGAASARGGFRPRPPIAQWSFGKHSSKPKRKGRPSPPNGETFF